MTELNFNNVQMQAHRFEELLPGRIFTLPNEGGLYIKLQDDLATGYNAAVLVATKGPSSLPAGYLTNFNSSTIIDEVSEITATIIK